jgi:shikimate kinase
VWNAGAVTAYRIRLTGPAALVVRLATELADADGVELTSSEQPTIAGESSVELGVSVEGTHDDVTRAVSNIRDELPKGASIEIAH